MTEKIFPPETNDDSTAQGDVGGERKDLAHPRKPTPELARSSPIVPREQNPEALKAVEDNILGLLLALDSLYLYAFTVVAQLLYFRELSVESINLIVKLGTQLFQLLILANVIGFVYSILTRMQKGGLMKRDKLQSSSIVSLSHNMIKSGKDFQRIAIVYNEKKSSEGLITKAFPLAEKLFSAADRNRKVSKMVNQLGKDEYESCLGSGAFEVSSDEKIVVKADWGGDYALLYALCYVHINKLYDSNLSRSGFNLRRVIKNWQDSDWADAAIYASLICHDKILINSLVNFPPKEQNREDYPKMMSLVYRIIQLRPSIGNDIQVAQILDDVLHSKPDR